MKDKWKRYAVTVAIVAVTAVLAFVGESAGRGELGSYSPLIAAVVAIAAKAVHVYTIKDPEVENE